MAALKAILAATDLSARCDRAIDRAAQIAADTGARLIVLHAVERNDPPEKSELERRLRETLCAPAVDAQFMLREEPVPEALIKATGETGSGLIVTGVARYNSLRDYVLGTAVDYIVRKSHVPVLIVRQRPHHPYRRILALTDFSPASRAALETAAALFPQAALILAHAWRVPFEGHLYSDDTRKQVEAEAQGGMDAFLKTLAPALRERLEARLVHGDMQQAVLELCAGQKPDLVVMGTQGQSASVHIPLGSMAERLLPLLDEDTLMVPPGVR